MTSSYERLNQQDDELESSFQESTLLFEAPPPLAAGPSSTSFVPGGRDGVFSNLSAKPEITQGKVYEDIEPPCYSEALLESDPTPPYLEHTVISSIMESGDVFIDGMVWAADR